MLLHLSFGNFDGLKRVWLCCANYILTTTLTLLLKAISTVRRDGLGPMSVEIPRSVGRPPCAVNITNSSNNDTPCWVSGANRQAPLEAIQKNKKLLAARRQGLIGLLGQAIELKGRESVYSQQLNAAGPCKLQTWSSTRFHRP